MPVFDSVLSVALSGASDWREPLATSTVSTAYRVDAGTALLREHQRCSSASGDGGAVDACRSCYSGCSWLGSSCHPLPSHVFTPLQSQPEHR